MLLPWAGLRVLDRSARGMLYFPSCSHELGYASGSWMLHGLELASLGHMKAHALRALFGNG